jgi:hypothetical protein
MKIISLSLVGGFNNNGFVLNRCKEKKETQAVFILAPLQSGWWLQAPEVGRIFDVFGSFHIFCDSFFSGGKRISRSRENVNL